MLYTFQDSRISMLIGELLRSMHNTSTDFKQEHSGIYNNADVCLKTLLSGSVNFVFEFFESYSDLKTKSMQPRKMEGTSKFLNKNFPLKQQQQAMKAHFEVFPYKNGLFAKNLLESGANFSNYLTSEQLVDTMISRLNPGLRSVEFIQYYNFLRFCKEGHNTDNCYVINIYKKSRMGLIKFDEFNRIIDCQPELEAQNTKVSAC